jgi:hypothetical protein
MRLELSLILVVLDPPLSMFCSTGKMAFFCFFFGGGEGGQYVDGDLLMANVLHRRIRVLVQSVVAVLQGKILGYARPIGGASQVLGG